jgi:fucose 4-O-acetylase-like acetyltransferase
VNRPRNNLDALRLFAAMLVLVGHSYIFMGVTDPIFLAAVPLGPLGVSIFFVISGYLVSESWDRDPDAVRFLARRALRIVPGLAVCIFLTAFLLGPALTTLPLSAYFKHPTVWDYLYNIGLYISYSLPGVFEKNRIAHSVNGSLWSLPVEFLLYLVVALVGLLRGNRWVYLSLGIASAIATAPRWPTDGKIWMDGQMVDWRDAKIHVLTHTLHYGCGAFEGVRAYNTVNGTAIFRLEEHTERLFNSAKILRMKIPFTKEEVNEAQKAVVRENKLESCYLRPLTWIGDKKLGVSPRATPST